MTRNRAFCFTYNNYDDSTILAYQSLCDSKRITYLIYGKEVGESGTPHLQGYVRLPNPTTIVGVQKLFRLHGAPCAAVFVANGSAQENIDYCSKEDPSPFIYGDPGPGRGSKLHDAISILDNGGSLQDVAINCPQVFIQYGAGIKNLIAIRSIARTEPPVVIWCCGSTGTGKSRWSWEHFPQAYSKDPTHRWWDGYTTQDAVIMDDYRPSKEMPFHYMLRLLDRYPISVEIKGGTVQFRSKFILITSPSPPRETFHKLEWIGEEMLDQMDRRITYVIPFPLEQLPASLALILPTVAVSSVT